MSVNRYADLLLHVGHEIECVAYGDDVNVAIECVDCGEVLLDFDQHDDKDGGPPIEWERGPFQAPEMARPVVPPMTNEGF